MASNRLLLASFLSVLATCSHGAYPSQYSDTLLAPKLAPGRTSSGQATFDGAQPLGNGDVAALVWVNATEGTVEFYVRKADAQGRSGDEMVIAWVRVAFSPNPFAIQTPPVYFNQTLDLAAAMTTILAGGSGWGSHTLEVSARVDANANVLVLDATARDPLHLFTITATTASVRAGVRTTYPTSWSCFEASSDPDVHPDPLPPAFIDADMVVQYHRNSVSDIDGAALVLAQQNITQLRPFAIDPWSNRTFGVALDAGGGGHLVRTSPSTLASREPAATARLRVTVGSAQTLSADVFLGLLAAAAAEPLPSRDAHAAWWASFWARSSVEINATAALPAARPSVGDAAATLRKGRSAMASQGAGNATVLLWISALALANASTPAGPLAVWRDASGGAHDATQLNASAAPVFAPMGSRGVPAVVFSAARSSHLSNAEFAMPAGPSTVFAVFRDDGSPSSCCSGVFYARGSCRGISTSRAPDGSERLLTDWCYSIDPKSALDVKGRAVVAAVVYGASTTMPGNSSSSSFINGCPQTVNAAIPSAGGAGGFFLGTRNDELGRYFEGELYELVIYAAALDADAVAAVSADLAARWAVAPLTPQECPDGAYAISQRWATTRYLAAAQSRTRGYTMAFNGMLYMALRPPLADARTWGTLDCLQNTRIAYIPMLAAGDGDLHAAFLEHHLERMPLARARTQLGMGHDGVHWTECKSPIGTPSSKHYDTHCDGKSRPEGYPMIEPCYSSGNAFEYSGDGGTTEIALAALTHYYYTQNATALARFLPLASLAATFFDLHYGRDARGRLRIFPTGVLEHRWCAWNASSRAPSSDCCENDLPAVAGITHLLEQLLTVLPLNVSTPEQRAAWAALQAVLPPLPATTLPNGTVVLLDAEVLCSPGTNNVESAPQYAVYPNGRFTVGRALGTWGRGGGPAGVPEFVKPAVDAFYADPNANSAKSNTDWGQGVMDAALLGLTDDASRLVLQRALTPPAPGYSWSGFAPSVHDYSPQTELFAGMSAAVNFMLLQSGDDAAGTIVLLPAWPCEWAVRFRLWAPLSTVVELDYAPAAADVPAKRDLVVEPPHRAAQVVWARCGVSV